MGYYGSDILHELIIGQEYSEKQLAIFVVENYNVTVVSKSCSGFIEHSQQLHKVLEIIEGFEHKGDRQRIYNIPSKKSKIYIVD